MQSRNIRRIIANEEFLKRRRIEQERIQSYIKSKNSKKEKETDYEL